VLKYRLPPARTLELGCGHGGFVALMRWAGFDATGLELSPWLVEYAKSAFGVPMFTGTIEKQNLEPDSLDIILHFDVLEHLPDPRTTMQRCMELLKPDGFMIVQTPCFPLGRTYEEMVRNKDRFLEMLRPAEHLCIFSRQSLVRLFSELGAPFLYFEPAVFDHYDMFAVASARELTPHSEGKAAEALLGRPEGRIVQALLDANLHYKELERRYQESEADRQARLELLGDADARIRAINAEGEAISQVLSEIEASYKLQMSYGLARLLRRLQAPLKMDALYKAMEERLASNSAKDGANAAQ
jgi:SAM-dependent methyltransferase